MVQNKKKKNQDDLELLNMTENLRSLKMTLWMHLSRPFRYLLDIRSRTFCFILFQKIEVLFAAYAC